MHHGDRGLRTKLFVPATDLAISPLTQTSSPKAHAHPVPRPLSFEWFRMKKLGQADHLFRARIDLIDHC